jgi:hypothetical protein
LHCKSSGEAEEIALGGGTGDRDPANGEPAQGDEPPGASADGGGQADGGADGGGQADGGADGGGQADGGPNGAGQADGGANGGGQADGGANGGGEADCSAGGARAGEPVRDKSADDQSRAAAAETAQPTNPAELLGEVRAIRRRARLARHAYWFPLVLFGLLTLASVPFYIRRNPGPAAFAIARDPLVLQSGFLGGPGLLELAEGTAYYWLGAMLLGIIATVLWYRWRGDRIGLRTPARSYLITALALVALALLIPVVSGRSIRMPLLWPGDYVISGLFPLVLIGLGLFVLAWSERSSVLAVIAAGYLAISLVANLYILNNLLYRLHWNLSPWAAALPNVVLPALVLLLSGAGAWVVQRRYRPPAEFAPEG